MTLSLLSERTASPSEIAEFLDEPLRSVSHQVNQLLKAGLIELVSERKRGSATEHFYRGCVEEKQGLDEMDLVSRQLLTTVMVQLMIGDLTRAMQTRSLTRRPDTQLNRLAMELDSEGREELKAAFQRALDDAVNIRERSEARLERSAEDPTRVVAAIGLFDAPSS